MLIKAILRREIAPSCAADKLGEFEFYVEDLKGWLVKQADPQSIYLTIPDLAISLNIKQEVAYHLVRKGIIEKTTILVGRLRVQMISKPSLQDFDREFVSARKVAKELGTSPKALIGRLGGKGIYPAMGPAIDGCRQCFYRRVDINTR